MLKKLIKKLKLVILSSIVERFYANAKKTRNLVLFGAMNGNYYGDNSQHIFEWVAENKREIRAVWITRNRSVYRELKTKNKSVALAGSLYGTKLLFQADMAFFTNSLSDISYNPNIFPQNINLIALRHGRSVKRIRFARKKDKISDAEARLRNKEGNLIRYAASTSDFISDMQEECLQIGRNKHMVTGYPRNDALFKPTKNQHLNWNNFIGENKFNKILLYGPSWRHERESTKFFPFDDFEPDYLFSLLKNIIFNYFFVHTLMI